MKFLFLYALLSSTFLSAQLSSYQYPLGHWYGQLTIAGKQFEILFFVQPVYKSGSNKTIKNRYHMELLNPEDSSAYPFLVTSLNISAKKFEFEIKDLNLKYTSKPSVSKTELNGTFEQNGFTSNLIFGRSRFHLKKPDRPQTPKPPYAYHIREVKIPHIRENFNLAGTLTLPADTTAPFPLVVMASGSGPQDRDEEILDHRMFLVLADYLARNGVGSLRFDDRGVGNSGGVFKAASLVGFSEDVESVFDFLKKSPVFAEYKTGILGHSEGAMHAWMVAKRRSDVDFIISLAGPAVSGAQIIEQQQYDIAILQSEEQALWVRDLFRGIIDIVSKNPDAAMCINKTEKFIKYYHKKSSKTIKDKNPLRPLMQTLPTFLNSAWGREFLAWSPDDYLPNYKGGVLYIIGDKDLQVNPDLNFNGFLKYIKNYKVGSLGALRYENLNHLLQTCKTCTLEEYAELEETISPVVMSEILIFLKRSI